MRSERRPKRRWGVTAASATVAVGLMAGGIAVAGAGTASADPHSLTLTYTCTFPLINQDPITVAVTADIPSETTVGTPTPAFAIHADTLVSSRAAQGIGLVGGTTIEGTATAKSQVVTPDGTLDVQVPMTVGKTAVPNPPAQFHVPADGQAPSLTFQSPGQVKILVGDLSLTLTPRTASGGATGLGTFTAPCTQDPAGQNNTLATVTVDPATTGGTMAGSTSGSTSGSTAGTTAGSTAGTTAGSTAGTTSGSTAGSGTQNLTTTVNKVTTPPGTLSMNQAGDTVALSPVDQGSGTASTGKLNTVTVTDAREGATGWSLTGKVTDFTGAGTITADKLSWTPACVTKTGSASTCVAGTPGTVGTAGATLASAPDGTSTGGEFTVDAGLSLAVPADAPAGSYNSVLTLTLA